MSRRSATFTQADVARALRAAQQAGPDWTIEITAGSIRLTRVKPEGSNSSPAVAIPEPTPEEDAAKWKF